MLPLPSGQDCQLPGSPRTDPGVRFGSGGDGVGPHLTVVSASLRANMSEMTLLGNVFP